MIIISAVDNRNGMQFNGRRQSQDSVLQKIILNLALGSKLWMNAYTAKQFKRQPAHLQIDEDFLQKAAPGEYCFVEDCSLIPHLDQIEKVILFRWGRDYPGDLFFDIPLTPELWQLIAVSVFPGSSHESITEEVYLHK